MDDSQELQQLIAERLASLPKVVQEAIASSEVQNHLRELSNIQKLHIDQWESLEHEVMLTLLGIHAIEELEHNIATEVGVTNDAARTLAEDINKIVFEPIRQELERQLEHPDAQAKTVSDVEAARNQALGAAETPVAAPEAHTATNTPPTPAQPAPVAPTVQPATPPAPAPDIKAARPSDSSSYKPGEVSSARAEVHDDPYREPPV